MNQSFLIYRMSRFVSLLLLIATLAQFAPSSAEICPFGFIPDPVDYIIAIENTNATGLRAFMTTQEALLATFVEFGRYVAPSKIRIALATFGRDICTTINPCSSFLDHPQTVAQRIQSLNYNNSQMTGNVQNVFDNFTFSPLLASQRRSAPIVMIVLTASDDGQLVKVPSTWPIQVFVVDMRGNTTVSRLERLLSTNLGMNQVLDSAWANSSAAPKVFAASLSCSRLLSFSFLL